MTRIIHNDCTFEKKVYSASSVGLFNGALFYKSKIYFSWLFVNEFVSITASSGLFSALSMPHCFIVNYYDFKIM